MMKNAKKQIVIIAAELLIAAGAAFAVGKCVPFGNDAETEAISDSGEEDLIYDQGHAYQLKYGIETVMFTGVDQYEIQTDEDGYNNLQQADWIMLLIIDHKNETYQCLHINRDTMCQIPMLDVDGQYSGSYEAQLALAHTYGSGGKDSDINMKHAVSDLLYGITIDDYICLPMDAISEVNDAAGGVTLTVMDDMTAMDPELVQGETVTLMGDQALTYIRSRQGLDEPTNIHRMERQQQYISALKEQIFTKWNQDDDFSMSLIESLAEYMITDCTTSQLNRLAEKCRNYTDLGDLNIEGQSVEGQQYMEFYPDEDMLKSLVLDTFYKEVQ